jgi:hypothetical protein
VKNQHVLISKRTIAISTHKLASASCLEKTKHGTARIQGKQTTFSHLSDSGTERTNKEGKEMVVLKI